MDFNDILDSLPISIYRVDCEGRVTYANRVVQQQLGLSSNELLGKTAHDLYPQELAEKYHSDDMRVIATKTEFRTVEEHWVESEGRMTYVEVIKQPLLNEQGECVGIQGLYTDISEIREKLIDAEHRAMTDPLTELPNRKAIELQLKNSLAKSKRNKSHFSLVFIDLDGFKQINDIYGHIAGDHLLVEFAKRLLRVTRGNDSVGRYAGDEFILILDGASDLETFIQWYQRAIIELCKPIKLANSNVEATVAISIGACRCPHSSLTSIESMLHEADKMMYQAKRDKTQPYYIFGY
jgi:diguanylate cyclase (GGDEF)-like protein/PAS domain S-box-containing protein